MSDEGLRVIQSYVNNVRLAAENSEKQELLESGRAQAVGSGDAQEFNGIAVIASRDALEDQAAALKLMPAKKAMLRDIAAAADTLGHAEGEQALLHNQLGEDAERAKALVSAIALLKPGQFSMLDALVPPRSCLVRMDSSARYKRLAEEARAQRWEQGALRYERAARIEDATTRDVCPDWHRNR